MRCNRSRNGSNSSLCTIFGGMAVSVALVCAMSSTVYAGILEWKAHTQKGLADYERGQYRSAAANFEAALKEAEALGETDPRLSETLNNLSVQYVAAGDYGKAELILRRLLRVLESSFGGISLDVASTLNNLAMVYIAQGKLDPAELPLKRSVEILKKLSDATILATTLDNLSDLYTRMGRSNEASQMNAQAARTRASANDKRATLTSEQYEIRRLPRH